MPVSKLPTPVVAAVRKPEMQHEYDKAALGKLIQSLDTAQPASQPIRQQKGIWEHCYAL